MVVIRGLLHRVGHGAVEHGVLGGVAGGHIVPGIEPLGLVLAVGYSGKEQNGNFYPECYIIPLDGAHQKNLDAADQMLTYLTRNGVKCSWWTYRPRDRTTGSGPGRRRSSCRCSSGSPAGG